MAGTSGGIKGNRVTYGAAAAKLHWLMTEAQQRRLSGVTLKENAPQVEDSEWVSRPEVGGELI